MIYPTSLHSTKHPRLLERTHMVALVRVQGLADDGRNDARPNVTNEDHVGDRDEDGHDHEDGRRHKSAGLPEGGLCHLN